MTDTGPVPGEGLPGSTGEEAVQQPHSGRTGGPSAPVGHHWSTDAFLAPATPAFTFADPSEPVGQPGYPEVSAYEDDQLLMPGPQGSWGDPQGYVPQQHNPHQAHQLQQHAVGLMTQQHTLPEQQLSAQPVASYPLTAPDDVAPVHHHDQFAAVPPVVHVPEAEAAVAPLPMDMVGVEQIAVEQALPEPAPVEPVFADPAALFPPAPEQVPVPEPLPEYVAEPPAAAPAADMAAPAAPAPVPAAGQIPPARRPLNLGPPQAPGSGVSGPDTTGGVPVRSLADRGPTPPPAPPVQAVTVAPPQPEPTSEAEAEAVPEAAGEPEYFDAPVAEDAPVPAQQTDEQGAPVAEAQVAEPQQEGVLHGVPADEAGELADLDRMPVQEAVAAPAEPMPPVAEPQPEPQPQPEAQAEPEPEPAPAAPEPEAAAAEQPVQAEPVAEAPEPAELPQPEPAEQPEPVAVAEQPEQPEPVAEAVEVAEVAEAEPVVAAESAPAQEAVAVDAVAEQPVVVEQPVVEEPVQPAEVQEAPEAVAAPMPPETEEAPEAEQPAEAVEQFAEAAEPAEAVEPEVAAEPAEAAEAAAPAAEPAPEPVVEPAAEPEPEAVAEAAPAEAAAEAVPADVQPASPEEPAEEPTPVEEPADPAAEAVEPAEQPVQDAAEEAAPAAEPEPVPVPVPVPVQPAHPGYEPAVRDAVHRVIRDRRDIRNGFRQDPIPPEVLLRVLEAAHTAPSVGHSQPWDFVVIRSEKTRERLHELAMRQRDAYASALPKARAKQFRELKIEAILETPVNIVVTADATRGGRHTLGRHTQPQMAPYSSALAVENLWLAARAEGLGVGWVSFFDEREMVRELGLPEHLEVVAYLCVGYVDEFPEEPELVQAGWSKRRPLSWVVHEEEYGNRALPGEEPHDLLDETLRGIRPLDAKALGEAWERQKRMTKPSGALGMLEIISAQLSGLSRQCPPPIPEPAAVAIFAGDHGVHAQGVTAWPQEVTAQMVANFLGGGAVCNAFANQVGAEVCVVDVGVAAELPTTPGLLPRKVRLGTDDFTAGPAMSRADALRAVEVGIETARDLVAAGNKVLLTGEMGIANTTASAALIAVYTGADPAEVTGRGTGINDEMHARKVDVVRRALELHSPDPADPIGVLAAIGGLEHAAIVGLLLGGASLRTPVILDGVSAGAAALVARAIAPEALAACIAGHRSAEPGHVAALTKLGLRPLVDLDLRLGEGTGALLALPLVQSAARVMHEVATFDAAGVTEKG